MTFLEHKESRERFSIVYELPSPTVGGTIMYVAGISSKVIQPITEDQLMNEFTYLSG